MNFNHHKHYWNFNFRTSKEGFLVFKAGPSPAPAGENKAWTAVKKVGGKVGRVLGPPARGMYYMAGGGALTYGYKAAKFGLGSIRDGFIYAGDKVNEAGHYTRGAVKQVLGGTLHATAGAGWEVFKSFPRDMLMSTYGVAKEATKAYWEAIKSPVYFGQGVRQMVSGLFGKPLGIGKNLLTLNFKQALSDAKSLRPVQMLEQAFKLDFKGVASTTRSLISDILAPIHRPATPVLTQVGKVFGMEAASNSQYYTVGYKEAKARFGEGIDQISQAGAAGSAAAANFRAELDAERTAEAEEHAAQDAAEEEENNPTPKPKVNKPPFRKAA